MRTSEESARLDLDVTGPPWPCLYCGQPISEPSDEHVLQAAFGTSLVLQDDVCLTWNGVLSRLDKRLIDLVQTFVYWDGDVPKKRSPLRQGLKVFLDSRSGAWISCWLQRDHTVRIPPQAIFMCDHVQFEASPPEESARKAFQQIQAELMQPTCLSLKDDLHPPDEPPIQPALVRTAPSTYLVRAQDEETIVRLRAAVASGTFVQDFVSSGVTTSATSNPRVKGRVTIDLGSAERAIAKTTLNFACVALGPERVRTGEFDPIREFIMCPYLQDMAGFVRFLFGDGCPADMLEFARSIAPPDRHTLFFAMPAGVPIVIVALYGAPFAVVYLVRDASPNLDDMRGPVLARFDYRAKTHEIIRLRDGAEPFVRAAFDWRSQVSGTEPDSRL